MKKFLFFAGGALFMYSIPILSVAAGALVDALFGELHD